MNSREDGLAAELSGSQGFYLEEIEKNFVVYAVGIKLNFPPRKWFKYPGAIQSVNALFTLRKRFMNLSHISSISDVMQVYLPLAILYDIRGLIKFKRKKASKLQEAEELGVYYFSSFIPYSFICKYLNINYNEDTIARCSNWEYRQWWGGFASIYIVFIASF